MNKVFYPKLAADNIKKNAKTYIPYIVTCIFTTAMYYIMASLSHNKGLYTLVGADTITETMNLGCIVVSIFAFIFLMYTNSFLMKQRKKEFGLFNILGMEKRHLSRVSGLETIYILIISILFGLFTGILMDKLMYLIILRMINLDVSMGFYISKPAIKQTLLLFSAIFLIIFLNSIRQIHLAKPIELLQSKNAGEKEPRAKWILSILGLLCLAGGYYISVTTTNPTEALMYFFGAVVLVIIGTYLLFIAGSITLLKALRKNKSYYYKTRHFISISSMIYRMKQNAAGLASICILSTMVLVMISSTSSLMVGFEDIMQERYPYDITVETNGMTDEENQQLTKELSKALTQSPLSVQESFSYRYLTFCALRNGDSFSTDQSVSNGVVADNLVNLLFVPLSDYNKITGSHATLNNQEILISTYREKYDPDQFQIFGRTYTIKQHTDTRVKNGLLASNIAGSYYIVVKDMAELNYLEEKNLKSYGEYASTIATSRNYNVKGSKNDQVNFSKVLSKVMTNATQEAQHSYSYYTAIAEQERNQMLGIYGGLFFLGIFLGTLFTLAAILIIYYKQISEGYDDKEQYEIMQKVGLSHEEVRESIQSQILTVFFLPLIMAGIHVAFAFPVISRILRLLNLLNTALYVKCTIICFVVFALIYGIIYSITAKAYYQIVRR